MNAKLATRRMRTGQWADIIKGSKESSLKVDDYCSQHGLSPAMPTSAGIER